MRVIRKMQCSFIVKNLKMWSSIIFLILCYFTDINAYAANFINDDDESIVLVKEPQPGWVRFCSGEIKFDIFSNQCSRGFFWKPDFNVGDNGWDCVCSRGAWRRSNKWCSDEDVPRFVEGDITCFTPEKDFQGMLYLGDQFSSWDSGEPYFLSSYKSGFTIKKDDFEKMWKLPQNMKNDDAGILIVRPRDDWTVEIEDENNPKVKLCLRAPIPSFSEEIDGIYIYNVSLLFKQREDSENKDSSSEFKLIFTRACFSWKRDDGNKWYEIMGESIQDKNMIVEKYSNTTATDACQICMSTSIPEFPKMDVYGNPIKAPDKKTVYDLKNIAVLTSEINLQSERLGLYWTNRMLQKEGIDYAKGDVQELEILERAAVLAYGTCNMKYIPKEFYQYFLIMFRKLLSESMLKYPPINPINPEHYKKIQDLLTQCKNRTKPIDFVVEKGCPEKYSKYQKYKSENGTQIHIPKVNDYNAEPAKHDYMLEFAWNLLRFLHYHCFPEFKDDSVLHDMIQTQLESLFTEDILLRWFNPSLAFRMYDHIFKTSMDLKTTMGNFEKCVRVVHNENKFPIWLKRPIDQPHRTQQSLFAKKKRRKKRDVNDEGTVSLETMESEIADMSLGNIRKKRTDDEELSNEEDESITSFEESSTAELPNTSQSEEDVSLSNTASSSSDEEIEVITTTSKTTTMPTESFIQDTTTLPTTISSSKEVSSIEDDEIRWKRQNDNSERENDTTIVLDIENSTESTDVTDRTTTTIETESSEGQELGSIEAMYMDDSLEAEQERADKEGDKVWNKFTVHGVKGFVGACIDSMSTFVKESKLSMEDCW